MIVYRQGEIVLIQFPFTDGTTGKQRPALIISSDWYNSTRPDRIMAAITSTVPKNLDPDYVLIKGAEISQTGLLSESVILLGKIFTLESSAINKTIGSLNGSLKSKVNSQLKNLFTI
jgi:mRNA interferase MazF